MGALCFKGRPKPSLPNTESKSDQVCWEDQRQVSMDKVIEASQRTEGEAYERNGPREEEGNCADTGLWM